MLRAVGFVEKARTCVPGLARHFAQDDELDDHRGVAYAPVWEHLCPNAAACGDTVARMRVFGWSGILRAYRRRSALAGASMPFVASATLVSPSAATVAFARGPKYSRRGCHGGSYAVRSAENVDVSA